MKAYGIDVIGGLSSNDPSDIEIDNEAADSKILARDHETASVAEVSNIVYGTGSPPDANTTPIGTIFIKYVA